MSQVEHGLGDLVLRPDGNGVANVVLLVVHELTEEAAEVAVLPTVAPVARSEEHTDLSTRITRRPKQVLHLRKEIKA